MSISRTPKLPDHRTNRFQELKNQAKTVLYTFQNLPHSITHFVGVTAPYYIEKAIDAFRAGKGQILMFLENTFSTEKQKNIATQDALALEQQTTDEKEWAEGKFNESQMHLAIITTSGLPSSDPSIFPHFKDKDEFLKTIEYLESTIPSDPQDSLKWTKSLPKLLEKNTEYINEKDESLMTLLTENNEINRAFKNFQSTRSPTP